MPAVCIAGKSGSVTFTTANHYLKSRAWSLTVNQEVNDSSGFASTSDFRENLGGMKSWSGAVSGYVEKTAGSGNTLFGNTVDAGSGSTVNFTDGTITLLADTNCTYGGSIIVTSVSTATGIDGNMTAAITFVGTGILTEVWDIT